MSKQYETVIGLEVHVELATKTKIFCGCSTAFGGAPNTHTCPVCTGMPGSLPVLNKQVVEYAMAVGLAANCQINQYCKFDRKNYFYPDNPQNYQISQLYLPICHDGWVEIETESGVKKKIGIHEIHMEHVPGGSSGGSCAAVAANECFYALGSDTGGSIRQPSSFCGVTGIKPTYGTVSRYGLIAYGSSLDQIGPVAKDVSDCAAILEAISSHDLKDSTSMARTDCDFTSALKDDVKGMKIGIPSSYFGEGLDEEVKAAILKAADILKEKGAVVETFDLGLVDYAIPAYYVIASAEASSNLSRFDGVKYGYRTKEYEGLHNMYKKTRSEGFGPEVKRRIMLGSFVLSSGYYDAYYLKALRTKALIKKEFDKAFAKYDLILAPASPDTAPLLGSSLSDPLKMYLGDIYTISVNLAGLPGMTVPCGLDSKGLPIGMQLIGDCFKEKDIIRAGYAFECTRKYEMPELAKVSD